MVKRRLRIVLIASILMAACSGQYAGVPGDALLAYQTDHSYGNLHNLAVAYAERLNAAVAADTVHPGLYADYGVALALLGHPAEASQMLNAEACAFPQSRPLILQLKQQLLPSYLADTLFRGADTANLAQLRSWAGDERYRARLVSPVASVIDSTDTHFLRIQTPVDSFAHPVRLTANQKREQLQMEQQRAQQRARFVADSIAEAKQAKIDARNRLKAEKQAAKKEQQKAKKQAEKEKKRLAKERERNRQQEKQQRNETRKQQQSPNVES